MPSPLRASPVSPREKSRGATSWFFPAVADSEPTEHPTAADHGSAAVDVRAVAREVFGTQGYGVICRYRDILASRGIDWGLLGPREVDRLWERHILNSVAVAELIPEDAAV